MKIVGKIVIALIALLLVLALLPALIPDEEYSSGAKAWLVIAHAPAEIPAEDNRFHAQVGLLAPAEADMVEYGARLVRDANQVLESNGGDFDPAWRDPPLALGPALQELEFDRVIDSPLAWLADNRPLLRRLSDENAVLLERYRKLTEIPGYALTLTPHHRAPIPDYSRLAAIHRLNSLVIAATVVDDGDNLLNLRQAIDKQLFALADAATVIEKMVGVAMLHFDFRLYADLLSRPGVAARHEPFPALAGEERTLKRAYITEFAIGASLLDGGLLDENASGFEKLMTSLYLKPRKLENHAYEHTWMRLLALESRPLAERALADVDATYGWWDRYTDPIGYILYEISRPGYGYHARIEHLDGLITLVNSAAEIHRESLRGAAIVEYLANVDAGAHPGYAGATIGYDEGNNEIFIELPGGGGSTGAHPLDRPPRLALD